MNSPASAAWFHGVRLATSGSSTHIVSALLAEFDAPQSEPEAGVIVFDVVEVESPALPATGARLFATDRLRAHRTEAGTVLTNGRSWVEVATSPPCVRGELAKGAGHAELELVHVAFLVALRALRVFELHAAVACEGDRALLLVGPSGAGKSTTALALLAAGCDYLGDDRILFRDHDGEIELLRYPVHLRATAKSLASFPELSPYASPYDYLGKRPFDVARAFPERSRWQFEGRKTLLFPEIGASTALRDLAQQAAFERLLLESGSLVLEGHAHAREHLDLLQRLVSQSRALNLTLGPEWLESPARAARALLSTLP